MTDRNKTLTLGLWPAPLGYSSEKGVSMPMKKDDSDMVWKQRVTGDVALPQVRDYVSKKSVPSVVTRRVHTGDVAPSDLSVEVTEYIAPPKRASIVTHSYLPYDAAESETPEEAFLGLIERVALVSGTSHFSRKTLPTGEYFTAAKSGYAGVSMAYDVSAHSMGPASAAASLKSLVKHLSKTGVEIELRDCSESARDGKDYPTIAVSDVLSGRIPNSTLAKALLTVSGVNAGAMVADIKMAESSLNEEFRQQRR